MSMVFSSVVEFQVCAVDKSRCIGCGLCSQVIVCPSPHACIGCGAGLTDIGIEPKGVRPDTFMRIAGIADRALAERYLSTAWEAIVHLVDRYRERVFLGVGMNTFVDPIAQSVDEALEMKPLPIDDPSMDAHLGIRLFREVSEALQTEALWLRTPDM